MALIVPDESYCKKKRAVRTEIDIVFITAILAIYTCL